MRTIARPRASPFAGLPSPSPSSSLQRFTSVLAHYAITDRDMPLAAAKIGLWIVGRAKAQGSLPVSSTIREMKEQTGCHRLTIRAALDWLENQELITVGEGERCKHGNANKLSIGVN